MLYKSNPCLILQRPTLSYCGTLCISSCLKERFSSISSFIGHRHATICYSIILPNSVEICCTAAAISLFWGINRNCFFSNETSECTGRSQYRIISWPSSSPRLSLLSLLTNTLPGPSASVYYYSYYFLTPIHNSQGMKKLRYAIQKSTQIKLEWTLLVLLHKTVMQ